MYRERERERGDIHLERPLEKQNRTAAAMEVQQHAAACDLLALTLVCTQYAIAQPIAALPSARKLLPLLQNRHLFRMHS